MDQGRWKVVNEIFHAALELTASERSDFVSAASEGDPEIQTNVHRLLVADDQAQNYLELPLLANQEFSSSKPSLPPFHAGDVLKNRFRILRHVGEGGMGHVYEAHDCELNIRVALKAIRPEISGDLRVLAFFRREVLTARTITHPNVCRTYDLDRGCLTQAGRLDRNPEEFFFLTMEFLEGETLATCLARSGPFSSQEALIVAKQIAAALDAAHEVGIIHRDIKPGNLMLVDIPSGSGTRRRVVVTDFGLARRDPLRASIGISSVSHTETIGTLAYMAPEQLEAGGPASPATDIYAFGLVLFEMVTGERVFSSANLLSGIAQRIVGPLPSPRAVNPLLPQIWEDVIQNCLRIKSTERFQTAGAVIQSLLGDPIAVQRGHNHADQYTQTEAGPKSRHPRYKLAAFVVIFVIAMALISLSFRLYKRNGESRVESGDLIYLVDVENKTGEPQLDNLTELIKASLEQSSQINLLDQSRIGDILQHMTRPPSTTIDAPVAREIAMRVGAVRVVFATVDRSDKGYRLIIDIQQPGNEPAHYREHWQKSFTWESPGLEARSQTIPEELSSAVQKAADWIRLEVGESKNDIARLDTPPEDVTTRNWQALAEYAHGKNLQYQNRPEDAVNTLKRALRLDPQFSLAYASLGDLLLSLHRDLEGYQAYDKGLQTGLENRLTRREDDRIRGMRAVDTGDYELAVDVFRDLAVNYPKDVAGWVYPTLPLRMLRRDKEAIANLRRAVDIDPDAAYAPYALAQEFMIEGQLQDASHWIEYLKLHKHPESAAEDEAVLFLLANRYADAAHSFELMASSANPIRRSYGYNALAGVQAETGRPRDAINTLNRGILEDDSHRYTDQQASKLLARAYLQLKLNHIDLCIEDEHAAFTLSPTPDHALAADTILGQAFTAASMKFGGRIRKELRLIQGLLPAANNGNLATLVKLRARGELELASGFPIDAVRTMEAVSTKDSPAGSRDYLARAFAAEAKIGHESKSKTFLIGKEETAYEAMAFHPAVIWTDMPSFPPGFYADQLSAYLQAASNLHIVSRRVDLATALYKQLRPFTQIRDQYKKHSDQHN
jgi:eukaryotic-like serine/threonine-protein kinase